MKKLLNGIDFHTYIQYGAREVIRNKDELNRINVFPVADGDTGSNLALTLQSMVDFTQVEDSFTVTAMSASEAAIIGARGNSGVLFAQFFSGLAAALKGMDRVSVADFVRAAQVSEQKLHQVLFAPAEGTIITVIRVWVQSLASRHGEVEGFEDLFAQTVPQAEKALEETTNQMELLRVNRVVDSGAKGFVLFLRGILDYLQGRAEQLGTERPALGSLSMQPPLSADHSASHHRYCCESILRGCGVGAGALTEALAPYGDSLIAAGEGDIRHIHIHTDDPAGVTSALHRFGTVTRPKVEDMAVQAALLASEGQPRVAIVTDSIADLPPELLDRHRVHVLPLGLTVGDRQYLDRLTLAPEDFYDMLDRLEAYPTSSLPSAPLIGDRLEWLLKHYDSVLIISVAAALSGTYDAFRRQVEALGAEASRVRLLDSRLNSGAQGLLVLKAARLAEQGLSLEEIAVALEGAIGRSRIFVALASFKYARRSGRIPKVVGAVGALMNLKPIVSLDAQGKGTAFSIAFSQKKLLKRIAAIVERTAREKGIESYGVVHGGNLKEAERLAAHLQALTGQPPEFIAEISSVTALHAGPGAVAAAFVTR